MSTSTFAGSWRAGTLIEDRYLLTGPVGAGGTATVWRARDERLDRMVAVKLLNHRFLTDDLAVQRLQVEAQALARLRHRHIAEVYDYGVIRQDGQLAAAYLVMELIDGVSVSQTLAVRHRLPWREAVTAAAQTADGLAAAHARGIVHRDISAGNVLLTADGARIIDFGICASAGSDELDADGNLIGTPAYLAPERVDGQPVQAAADVYALGVLLYRLLSGSLPWPADTPIGLLTAPRLSPPRPLPDISGLPAGVVGAVAACLDADPAARPTAAQLAETLAGAVDGAPAPVSPAAAADAPTQALPADLSTGSRPMHPLPAGPLPAVPPTASPARSRRRALVATAVLVGGLAAGGALWALTASDGRQDPAVAGPASATAQPGCVVVFRLRSDDGSRFSAGIGVTNATDTARTPARISFDLPGGQRIDTGARWRQDGSTVTATGRRTLAPGAETTLPVTGSYQGANPLPTTFRLDGQPCAVTLLGVSGAPVGTPDPSADPVGPGVSPGPAVTEPTGQESPDPAPASPTVGSSPTAEASPPPPASPAASPAEDGTGAGEPSPAA